MSSAPASSPSSASSAPSSAPSPIVCTPEIMEVRKGFFRWIWMTIKGTYHGVKNAAAALTVRPVKYVWRAGYNNLYAAPLNYANCQWNILKNSAIGKGLGFAMDSKNYKLFGGGHAHGGGEEGGEKHT